MVYGVVQEKLAKIALLQYVTEVTRERRMIPMGGQKVVMEKGVKRIHSFFPPVHGVPAQRQHGPGILRVSVGSSHQQSVLIGELLVTPKHDCNETNVKWYTLFNLCVCLLGWTGVETRKAKVHILWWNPKPRLLEFKFKYAVNVLS